MPSRFERYRVKDGVTPLGERFLNPVFQDIDLRLAGLEELRLSWEEAVRAVSEFGLVRINDVLGPAFADVTDTAAEIEAKRLAAVAALAQLGAAVASIETDATADITAWKAARLAELDAWRASLTSELPDIDARLDALETVLPTKADAAATTAALAAAQAKLPQLVQPDDLGNFTIAAGASAGQLAAVAGFGLYRYDPDSTEAADGETVLVAESGVGRWLLVSPHWDFVWAYLAGLLDDLQGQMDAVNLANPTALADLATAQGAIVTAQANITAAQAAITALQADKFAANKVLTGSASLDFASIAAGASATLTIAVAGAATTDRVVLNPPSTLPNGVVPVAYVSAADTVTVRLNNVTAAAIDPAAMTYLVTVIKP